MRTILLALILCLVGCARTLPPRQFHIGEHFLAYRYTVGGEASDYTILQITNDERWIQYGDSEHHQWWMSIAEATPYFIRDLP